MTLQAITPFKSPISFSWLTDPPLLLTLLIQDLERIASSGPSFNDVVLEHVERVYEPGSDAESDDGPVAEAYNYIPFSVLGDYQMEAEPNWSQLPCMGIHDFHVGLEAEELDQQGVQVGKGGGRRGGGLEGERRVGRRWGGKGGV